MKGFVKVTFIKTLGTNKKGSEGLMHPSTAKGCKVNGYVTIEGEKTLEKAKVNKKK